MTFTTLTFVAFLAVVFGLYWPIPDLFGVNPDAEGRLSVLLSKPR